MREIEREITGRIVDAQLTCEQAFEIVEKLDVRPRVVGQAADELGAKITECQLGLFGYEGEEGNRAMQPSIEGAAEMASAIRAQLVDGKFPCAAAWAMAERFRMGKMKVASAVEALGIQISQCQLGCFD